MENGVIGTMISSLKYGIKVYEANLDEKLSKELGKEPGRYITINTNELIHTSFLARKLVCKVVASELSKFLLGTRLLVVGLGNAFLVADSLSSVVIQNLLVTHNMPENIKKNLPDVCALITGVSGINGFATADLVKSVVNMVKPSQVIVIDAFIAHDSERLGRSFQISDSGITAGAGLGRKNQSLNNAFLNVPVVSIGVPLMMNVLDWGADENFVGTPKEIDILTRNCGKILSRALNLALYGKKYFDYV